VGADGGRGGARTDRANVDDRRAALGSESRAHRRGGCDRPDCGDVHAAALTKESVWAAAPSPLARARVPLPPKGGIDGQQGARGRRTSNEWGFGAPIGPSAPTAGALPSCGPWRPRLARSGHAGESKAARVVDGTGCAATRESRGKPNNLVTRLDFEAVGEGVGEVCWWLPTRAAPVCCTPTLGCSHGTGAPRRR